MARVTYGESVTEYAGSVGGVTFQKNASGNIARLRPNPTVNPTSLQAGYQTNIAKLVAYWPTLSQPNKEDWNTFAADHKHTTPWGVEKTLSGYQWFLSCNLNRAKVGQAPLDTPPNWFVPAPPPSFSLTATSTYIHCNWSPDYDPVFTLCFYITLPLRQSSLKLRRSLFFIRQASSIGLISYYDLTPWVAALYGVTWSDFFVSANCSIICRISCGTFSRGLFSSYTSAIVKIG
ncbi:hypothetical protein ES708_07240 [subsurface metagenome]